MSLIKSFNGIRPQKKFVKEVTSPNINYLNNYKKNKKLNFLNILNNRNISEAKKMVLKLEEKPLASFFVNTGVYCVSPLIFKYIKSNEPCDMTDIISRVLSNKKPVGCFPIHEYWIDIGIQSQLQKARKDFESIFQYLPNDTDLTENES